MFISFSLVLYGVELARTLSPLYPSLVACSTREMYGRRGRESNPTVLAIINHG